MLVTDPKNRAPLSEIMNHPWMTKGTSGPPENFLPSREPLQLPLDQKVIEKMTGFDFGHPEYIRNQLEAIINSEDYQRALKLYLKKSQGTPGDANGKRTSVFEFYQRRRSNLSKDGLQSSSTETLNVGEDPMHGFHPLLSIYYLVREKQEREKQEANPGATSIPLAPGEQPLQLPDLPPPQAAYTNSHTTEMKGENPTGGRSRPRARTHGDEEIQNEQQRLSAKPSEAQATSPITNEVPSRPTTTKRESGAAGIFRRFSTRTRNRDPEAKATTPPAVAVSSPDEKAAAHPPSASAATTSHPIPRPSFSMRKTRDRDTPPSSYKPPPNEAGRSPLLQPQDKPDYLAPPGSTRESHNNNEGRSSPNRLRKGLARSASTNSSDLRRRWSTRRGAADSSTSKSGKGTDSEKSSINDQRDTTSGTVSDRETETPMRRAFGARTRSVGHGRRISTALSRNNTNRDREHTQQAPRESDLPEETDAELAAEEADDAGYSSADVGRPAMTASQGGNTNRVSRTYGQGYESQEALKPVYLKGLFSVSTTSSKPLNVIRSDIIRVLRQLGVDFREMRGGFSCRHTPSIDLNHKKSEEMEKTNSQKSDSATTPVQTHKRKISFAGLRGNDRQREDLRGKGEEDSEKLVGSGDPEKSAPATPRPNYPTRGSSLADRPTVSTTYTSYNNSDAEESDDVAEQPRPHTLRKRGSRVSSSTHRPAGEPKELMAGETRTHVQSDMGSKNLAIRFEILVVKVPIVSLHGLQFKKVEGGTWQYKRMADRILGELRL